MFPSGVKQRFLWIYIEIEEGCSRRISDLIELADVADLGLGDLIEIAFGYHIFINVKNYKKLYRLSNKLNIFNHPAMKHKLNPF